MGGGLENIVLLSLRSPYLDSDKVYPPLGILYIHQKLLNERPSVNVTISDNYSLTDNEWMKGYDAIGVSIMTPQRAEANRLLEFVKQTKPNIKIIAGGSHAKYYLDEMKTKPWDYIVTHDGERMILDIVDGAEKRILTDPLHPRDFGKFVVKPARLENKDFLAGYGYKLNGRNSTTLLTAQGCPEHCEFCEDAHSFVRYHPFEQIVEELDDIQTLGYKGVYIFDDIFSLIQKRTEPIARELKKRDLIYRCNGQARLFTEKFADLLAETGCYEIAFGAESGSQKILDNIHKRTTVEQNYRFVKWCKERGIICKAFLMLGLPGENLETIADTERFIQEAGISDFQLSIYYPYKGTGIRDAIDSKKEGFDMIFEGEGLGAYGQKGGSTEAVVRTKALSSQELLYHRDRLVKTYRPHSHGQNWKPKDDMFFDTHLAENTNIKLGCSSQGTKLTVRGKDV